MKVMDKLNELNCIIFGIKFSIFSKKKITKYLNWPQIIENQKRFEELKGIQKENLKELEKRFEKKFNKILMN